MARVLLAYGTTEGQTQKIADAIAADLRDRDHSVDIVNLTSKSAGARALSGADAYDAVIVGASVHAGQYQRAVRHWVKTNATSLSRKPSAFFSVCLGILERDNPKSQEDERRIVENFLSSSGWKPSSRAIFAGAVTYSKYGWLTRFLMRRISKKAGGGADINQDYEYTDWNQVHEFARSFASELSRPQVQ